MPLIKKAVITAAGKGTRQYPATNAVQKELFPLVDLDGISKPTIQIIAEHALEAGIEEIAIIVQPDIDELFRCHFRGLAEGQKEAFSEKSWGLAQSDTLERLNEITTFITQDEQHGYGHAVYCAREWVGKEPFLLMLGDHVYLSKTGQGCTQQIVHGFKNFKKSIYGVTRTASELLYLFGTVAGKCVQKNPLAYELNRVIEKPNVAYARKHLAIPELPQDHYLTFFGLHIFTPTIFDVLQTHIENNVLSNGEVQLTTAQAELCQSEGAIGLEILGDRLDMGTPLGYLQTQLALALSGVFSHEINLEFRNRIL